MEILFIGKKSDPYSFIASEYLKHFFPEALTIFGTRGEQLPESLHTWQGDYVFSYLSPWIIPKKILESTRIAAINWHPGTPQYPGIGCTNFAIYNGESEFGITCHHMLAQVDTGNIIEVKRFPVKENDTVYSITQKCYSLILPSFYRIVEKIFAHDPLPVSEEKWTRKPFTRKELDALTRITEDMEEGEIEKRIKATTFDRPWAFVEVKGKRFYYQ